MNLKDNLLNERVAEVTLIYKSHVKPGERIQVTNSRQMAAVFRSVWDVGNIELLEESKVMYLNKANRVLGMYPISKGGIDGTIIDVQLVIIAALRLHGKQICICHNHPSGNTKPSKADMYVTEKIKQAAQYLNITLLDHIILTKDSYYSLAEDGMM